MLMELSTAKVKVSEKQPLRGNKSDEWQSSPSLEEQRFLLSPCKIKCKSLVSIYRPSYYSASFVLCIILHLSPFIYNNGGYNIRMVYDENEI